MPLTWTQFTAQRHGMNTQFFPCPERTHATPTLMLCSHIWWTEQIGLAFLNSGYNVLFHFPFYLLYTDDSAWAQFDTLWNQIIHTAREAKVQFILGGNTTAMLLHPKSGEMVHEAVGQGPRVKDVPLVNWWWDEPRARPPLERAGIDPHEYLQMLSRSSMTHAIWDLDVKEELEAQFGLRNLIHLPLATLPDYWPRGFIPLEQRPLAACFLGNCHFTADWIESSTDPLSHWSREVVRLKTASPETPMQSLITQVAKARELSLPVPHANPSALRNDRWLEFIRPWECLNAAYMHYTRNRMVQAAEQHLKGKLALVGKGWDKLGLRANMEHAADKSGTIYGQSQISLNLFGGCVHGGLPLRPYDIGASGGLIVTHDQRELRDLFEPGAECLAFRNSDEMIATIDKVRKAPAEFNQVALAGRKRVLAHHTWSHRIQTLLQQLPIPRRP